MKKVNRFFYQKLAANNIRKNSKTCFPYILTCIGTVMMFYNMYFLAVGKDIGSMSENNNLRSILFLGAIVIGIFSVIFLFYTNSFLIKQRKKEFGLFNILGMEKKHIARVMFFETVFIGLISLGAGLTGGILLSKLMILLLLKIISFKATFGFEVPLPAVVATIVLFGGIFLLNLIYNILQVHVSKPVELLKGSKTGEREPRTKWLIAVIGVICLGTGYYIAIATETPLAALNSFLIAVLLVIAGTYCLFTAGSVAMLKLLRNNKKYYYKLKHFTSVSGMIYRMKQNAAGLSNICILSSAVIVMLSTTISLYVGMEDMLHTRYPKEINVTAFNISREFAAKLDSAIEQRAAKAAITPQAVIRYCSTSFTTKQKGSGFTSAKSISVADKDFSMMIFMTAEDYNRVEGKNVTLSGKEALVYTLRGDLEGSTLSFNGVDLSVKERLTSLNVDGTASTVLSNSHYIIVSDLEVIRQVYKALTPDAPEMEGQSYYYGFNTGTDMQAQVTLTYSLQDMIKELEVAGYTDGPEISRAHFYALYGGLFFLGLFLGLLFIMATVLIIYYKQIAEGYDDKERFEIMQKVGMSHAEVKKSIQSQVLSVFFLPLITAVIHIAFAFSVITKLLSLFNLTNVPLFAGCTALTILVFAIFYALVYGLTARTYYRIVS